jgi:hypothetical protein
MFQLSNAHARLLLFTLDHCCWLNFICWCLLSPGVSCALTNGVGGCFTCPVRMLAFFC